MTAGRIVAVSVLVALAGCVSHADRAGLLGDVAGAGADGSAGERRDLPGGPRRRAVREPVARRVGDTLTIRLNERTNASKSSSTSTSKATNIEHAGPDHRRPAGDDERHRDPRARRSTTRAEFDGEGDSTQSNRLDGDITVTVAQRLPNGNLLVRGQKWIAINQGQEYVRIQGIVRPIDIDPDNSISSLKVADAMIAYGGKGALANANSPGAAGALLQSAVPAVLSQHMQRLLHTLARALRSRSWRRDGCARRARQGSRLRRGRAQQPARRLRPRRRPRRHRRPDQPGAVHDPEHPQHAREVRRDDSGERQPAAEERRRRDGARRSAAVREAGSDHRHHRRLHRQRRAACAAAAC